MTTIGPVTPGHLGHFAYDIKLNISRAGHTAILPEMFDELRLANKILNTALDRYLDACGGVRDYYLRSGSLASIPPGFTNHVGCELSSFSGLEERLRKAKLLISWSHNCSANLSPINILPPEVLLYIFQLVTSSQPCLNHRSTSSHKYAPAYPDTLVHVCSRWRYIAMNSPTLWSHIDLQTDKALLPGRWIVERAEAHATRAGQLPLDVHFPTPLSQTGPAIAEGLSRLLSGPTISTRARSLKVGFGADLNYGDPILQPLSRLFENCRPGTLTKLTIYSNTTQVAGLFIHGQEESRQSFEPTVIGLDLPQDQLDAVLQGVTALQLRVAYFPWTSPAYHGLLQLRLTGYQGGISITESQLAGMLQASPRLRVLEFGLHIKRGSPKDTPVAPIQLTDLEALDLSMCLVVDVEFFLQWLAPGSRPLQLSLLSHHPTTATDELVNSMQPFLNRSNMRTLYLMKPGLPRALALVDASPELQSLAIAKVQRGPLVSNYKPRFGSCHLESLYLLNSTVILEDLVAFLGLCPTRTLVIWDTKFDTSSYLGGQFSDDAILQELSKVCGDVRWLPESAPNPTKNWDLFSC